LIDSEVEKYNQQNAEEIEWERKKQEENIESEDESQLIKRNQRSLLGQLADASRDPFAGGSPEMLSFSDRLGRAYGHV